MTLDEPPPLQAVLFDLDGTLVDTAPDLAQALNRLRQEHGLEPLPYEQIRSVVSNGGSALIHLGFDTTKFDTTNNAALHDQLLTRLLTLYGESVAEYSHLFQGLEDLLDYLDRAAVSWGIVTNKPRPLTETLVSSLGLHCDVIVCPEDLQVKKPDPAPLLYAARQMAIPPEQCIYIGDHERDIEAGRRAGMQTIAVSYGYLGPRDDPEHWRPNHIISTPQALTEWLCRQLQTEAGTLPA